MQTCEYAGAPFAEPRSHPWTDVAGSPDCKYYDLTANPGLIRTALENFVPWQRYAAIDDFYVLLEALNRGESMLESNDCAFEGPAPDDSGAVPKALQCSGRLMVLFRAVAQIRCQARWMRSKTACITYSSSSTRGFAGG